MSWLSHTSHSTGLFLLNRSGMMPCRTNNAFVIEYRAAIALNNMAIALMERHAYRESLETLIDGCSLMESALRHQHSSTSDPSSYRLVEDKIQKSSMRLSTSLASSFTISSTLSSALDLADAVMAVNHDGLCLDSRTSMDSTISALKQDSFRLSPIRLEAVAFQDVEERNPELESGMMIFNLGVAYLCLSRSASQSRSASFKLRVVSVRLFRMAYDIVAKLETLQQLVDAQPETHENQLELVTRLLLAHMILGHSVQAHLNNGALLEALEAQEQLARLEKAIDDMGVSGNSADVASTSTGPAPAA
jgi:tetratricopeptide (TPR) repeat protein